MRCMKTFEGQQVREIPSEAEDARVVLLMYFLRAVSIILILTLLFYIIGEQLVMLRPDLKFSDFIFANALALSLALLFLFIVQTLLYVYRVRNRTFVKMSRGEIIMGYALPILGIIAAVYTAYALGVL